MTPYRDAPVSRRVHTHWTSQPFTTVMSGAICIGLSATGLVLLVARSSLVTTAFATAVVFGVLFQAGVVRLIVEDKRLLLVRGILWRRLVRATSIAHDARVRVTHRNRVYRAHVVELVTDGGSSVIAECDDPAEARAIAKFVEPVAAARRRQRAVTPYRDEEPSPVARTATRWYFTSNARFIVLSAIVLAALAIPAMVLSRFLGGTAAVGALVIAAILERSVRRIVVDARRVLVRSGFLLTKTERSISLADGGDVHVTAAGGLRQLQGGRQEAYVTHLVEVRTPNGPYVVFESDEAKRAQEMADFVRSAMPARLRIATPAELTDVAVAAAEEEAHAEDRPSATRR